MPPRLRRCWADCDSCPQRCSRAARVAWPSDQRPSNSCDDIGRELVLDEGDAVAQNQLTLFQALDLQDVRPGNVVQRLDGSVEVAMLLPQASQRRLELAPFLVRHRRRGTEPCGPAGPATPVL